MSHFFARCVSQKTHGHARIARVIRVQFLHVRVFSDSRTMQKRATKSGTSGHCLVALLVLVAKLVLFALR